ncbi:hypothetical protein GQ457_15G018980 [Hibiscus cannabinus]
MISCSCTATEITNCILAFVYHRKNPEKEKSCITYWRIEILKLVPICPENSRCIKTQNIKYWKKYWKILSWSKLSEGAKESSLENKASLEVTRECSAYIVRGSS